MPEHYIVKTELSDEEKKLAAAAAAASREAVQAAFAAGRAPLPGHRFATHLRLGEIPVASAIGGGTRSVASAISEA